MARSYLTKKQMPRAFWLSTVQHSTHMMNCILGTIQSALTSPFELDHHTPPDSRLWFPLFSVGYFHHQRDGSVARSGFQAQTLEGIAVGQSSTSNAMIFYNPRTSAYYKPDSYKLDPSRLPSTVWPSDITYDGGMFADLYRDTHPHLPEPFSPGSRVVVTGPDTLASNIGTVTAIPLKNSSGHSDPTTYMINLDNGTMHPSTLPHIKMVTPPVGDDSPTAIITLPVFLAHGLKVTLYHNGTYHKGFLLHLATSTYRFSV
jgi:hypothetical protein